MTDLPPPPPPTAPTVPAGADRDHREIATSFVDGRSVPTKPVVSPDGERVAFVVATTSVDDNTTATRVWLDGVPVTAGPRGSVPGISPA